MPKPADPHTVPHQATAERRRPRPRTVDLTAAVAETSAVAALAGTIDDGKAPHHHPRLCSGLREWFERRCCRHCGLSRRLLALLRSVQRSSMANSKQFAIALSGEMLDL